MGFHNVNIINMAITLETYCVIDIPEDPVDNIQLYWIDTWTYWRKS